MPRASSYPRNPPEHNQTKENCGKTGDSHRISELGGASKNRGKITVGTSCLSPFFRPTGNKQELDQAIVPAADFQPAFRTPHDSRGHSLKLVCLTHACYGTSWDFELALQRDACLQSSAFW